MEQQEIAVIAQVQGKKLRRPRKSLANFSSRVSSSGSLPSPSSIALDSLLSNNLPTKSPRRLIPFRFASKRHTELLNSKSSVSPPLSPTRIHKSRHASRIPSELSIHRTQIDEHTLCITDKHFEEPRLIPFDIPAILEQIICCLDELNTIPSEPAPVRRKPISYQHALLIYYPDVARAMEAWTAACRPHDKNNSKNHHSGVYACLLVNRDWNDATKRVLRRRAFFTNYHSWRTFSTRKSGHSPHIKTLVLHKIQQARNEELELLGLQPCLEWLELHVCPNLLPSEKLISSSFLKRIALPGCWKVDDTILGTIARHCPNLEVLDLRACELITDKGLIAIAEGCPKLKYLNVGRVKNGERVTCDGVDAIAR
jgi:Leucine Rich repeat